MNLLCMPLVQAGSNAQSVDQQSSVLPLCYGCPPNISGRRQHSALITMLVLTLFLLLSLYLKRSRMKERTSGGHRPCMFLSVAMAAGNVYNTNHISCRSISTIHTVVISTICTVIISTVHTVIISKIHTAKHQ